MSADIENCDRYCKQTGEDIFGVKFCAGVRAVEHLRIPGTRHRLCQAQFKNNGVLLDFSVHREEYSRIQR
jgi:hypothetical protein